MSIFSSYKKIFLLGFIIVILIAIPFSVYIAQKRQNISSKAAASTRLSFEPISVTTQVGKTLALNIWLDPGAGTPQNQVSFIKLSIKFDASKFEAISLAQNEIGNTLKEPIESAQYDNTAGTAKISLSIGADPTKAVVTKTKIAVLQLKATNATSPTTPNITFDTANTQVLSIASSDETGENVLLSTAIPATITVTNTTPIITTTPSSIPTQTPTTPFSAPSSTSSIAPICSSLDIDGPVSGTAPYPLTFTATGNVLNGTISKISFNFGDSIEDLTEGSGIGTSSVSAQLLHTYNTPGTYTAYAILTGSSNSLSTQQPDCTKTITITALDQPNLSTTIQPLPPTGDRGIMLGLGAIGTIFVIIGGVLLSL